MSTRSLGVALLGHGTVGAQVAELLTRHHVEYEMRVGVPLRLLGIAVRNVERARQSLVEEAGGRQSSLRSSGYADETAELLTDNAMELVRREGVDIVVELIGGIEPARTLVLAALDAGKSVVTANKALLAHAGPELYAAAAKAGVDLYYEAAAAGAIPIVRPLRESLAGDRVERVMGIVNGTTNFILDTMDRNGTVFDDALAEAQALGYAEADPTADVDGFDAAAKAAILASLAFHTRVGLTDVAVEGIRGITAASVASAQALDMVIKLLAVAERIPSTDPGQAADRISVRVHPVMLERSHPLAAVHGAYNAVFVTASAAGDLMFYGRGAGGTPTASAVLGDLVTVGRHLVSGGRGAGESAYADLGFAHADEVNTRFHIALEVADRAGVLARIAEAFAQHDVSIQAVHQSGHAHEAQLVIVTHAAPAGRLAATIEELRTLDVVREVTSVIRVLGEE